MADDLKIGIKVEGSQQAASDIRKLTDATEQTDQKVNKLDSTFKRAASGLNKFGREIPAVGILLDTVKNQYAALSAVLVFGIAKFREYQAELGQMVSVIGRSHDPVQTAGEKFQTAAEGVKAMAEAMKDLQGYTDAVVKGLQAQIEKIDEQFAATEKLLDVEAELAKLKVDRDEQDPVAAAKKKANIDEELALRKLGLSGRKGQQAAIIEKQISRERELQVEAGAAVPSRDALVASVSGYEGARINYESAFAENRQAFGKAELLRRFAREGNSPDFFKTFAPDEVRELQKMGLISGISEIFNTGVFKGDLKTNDALGRQLLPGAEAGQLTARDKLARARSTLNMARAVLPPGVSSIADIDPYISNASAEAAGIQNQSYGREMGFMSRRDQLLDGQRVDIELQKMQWQKTHIQGGLSVRQAEAAADKTAEQFERFTRRLEQRLERLERGREGQSFSTR